mmetsp:Transcript_3732/g.7136  ORF Transcript_3732/g.7136 Transcript_3732/m.7136 type:complete len:1172 (+) Transcript_3732:180-3695(+)
MKLNKEEVESTKRLHSKKWAHLHSKLINMTSGREDDCGLEGIDTPANRVISILRHSEKDNNSSSHKTWKVNHSKMTTAYSSSEAVPRRASIQQSEASSDQKPGRYKIQPFWGITAANANFNSSSGDRLGDSRGVIRSVGDLLPCLRVSHGSIETIRSLVHSKPWRIVVLLFEGMLLFGPPIRDWWCPKQSDGVFDVLFVFTIAVLFMDIVLMSYAVPKYFLFYIGFYPEKDTPTRTNLRKKYDTSGCGRCACSRFQIGGFIFWFDVISALTLLFDITWVNTTLTEYKSREIYVNSSGQMMSEIIVHGTRFPDFSSMSGLSRWYFILVALRTPRIARFMQGSGLVWLWLNISEKVESCQILPRAKNTKVNHGSLESGSPLNSEVEALQDSRPPQDSNLSHQVEDMKSSKNRSSQKFHKMIGLFQYHDLSNTKSHVKKKATPRPSIQIDLNRDAFDYVQTKSFVRSSRNKSSQVGKEMHELTVKRVALGCMIAFVVTAFFTNYEKPLYLPLGITTMHSTLVSMRNKYGDQNLPIAFNMVDLEEKWHVYYYRFDNITLLDKSTSDLREREKLRITVATCEQNQISEGDTVYGEDHCTGGKSICMLNIKDWNNHSAGYTLLSVLFIMCIWYAAVASFAGPITALIIIPMERMIKILNMLVKDPLGYQNSKKYRKFVEECEEIDRYSKWKRANLEGMETSFLMSTILRIGSLMQVGFGKAGAEIIRQSLEKQPPHKIAFLRRKSSDTNVSCIFLFCDIRRFTDTTECLLEEVFVFTNKIAAVVHSICHSYGGSANKNIGDAFLISWVLKERNVNQNRNADDSKRDSSGKKQADIALLAVIKIMIALNYESFFLDDLSPDKRKRLKSDSAGPLVQMGFGLHAGKAVQGAIGSRRKLDATYISNAVEQAEYLESSTKRYGVQMLMSGTFYEMLSSLIQRRCRKIDQVYFRDDDGDQFEDPTNPDDYEKMELYTHDIDVSHLEFNSHSTNEQTSSDNIINEYKKVPLVFGLTNIPLSSGTSSTSTTASFRDRDTKVKLGMKDLDSKNSRRAIGVYNDINHPELPERVINEKVDELVEGRDSVKKLDETLALPTEQCIYKSSIWLSDDMRIVRGKYAGADFFQQFNVALQHYFNGEWSAAKEIFEEIDRRFSDGPSKYYLSKMKETNFVAPRSFAGWNEA